MNYEQKLSKVLNRLLPEGGWSYSNDTLAFEDWVTPIDKTVIDAEILKDDAEYIANEYQRLRKAEYPEIGDQLDALWKGGAEADAMKVLVDAVKAKYPKPL